MHPEVPPVLFIKEIFSPPRVSIPQTLGTEDKRYTLNPDAHSR